MWHYFPRGPLENRVLKTRFIIQKNFKNHPSLKHSLTGMDQIRERVKSERGRPDKRERKSQIREGEKEIAWVARPGSHDPGARSGSRDPGARSLSLPLWSDYFSLSLIWSPSLWSDSLSDLIRSGEVRLCLRLGWFLKFFWIINRVFKTRFSSGPRGK